MRAATACCHKPPRPLLPGRVQLCRRWLRAHQVHNRAFPFSPDGSRRQVDKAGAPGITLYTSLNGAQSFKAACLPVLIRVRLGSQPAAFL